MFPFFLLLPAIFRFSWDSKQSREKRAPPGRSRRHAEKASDKQEDERPLEDLLREIEDSGWVSRWQMLEKANEEKNYLVSSKWPKVRKYCSSMMSGVAGPKTKKKPRKNKKNRNKKVAPRQASGVEICEKTMAKDVDRWILIREMWVFCRIFVKYHELRVSLCFEWGYLWTPLGLSSSG